MSLPRARGWNNMGFKAPCKPNHSMILSGSDKWKKASCDCWPPLLLEKETLENLVVANTSYIIWTKSFLPPCPLVTAHQLKLTTEEVQTHGMELLLLWRAGLLRKAMTAAFTVLITPQRAEKGTRDKSEQEAKANICVSPGHVNSLLPGALCCLSTWLPVSL